MNRKVAFVQGEYYHVYNRGIEKRITFSDIIDYKRFVLLLKILNTTENIVVRDLFKNKTYNEIISKKIDDPIVAIGAYCLMPNHFHLLIKETRENGITEFMQKLSTAYSMYFNIKHHRKGTLFEGPFKAEHANEDRYLKYLISYIHLNPVKLIDSKWKERGLRDYSKTKKYLDNYEFSSYFDYTGIKRPQNKILNMKEFPKYFGTIKDFDKEIFEWLSYGKEFLRQGVSTSRRGLDVEQKV